MLEMMPQANHNEEEGGDGTGGTQQRPEHSFTLYGRGGEAYRDCARRLRNLETRAGTDYRLIDYYHRLLDLFDYRLHHYEIDKSVQRSNYIHVRAANAHAHRIDERACLCENGRTAYK